MGLQGVFTETLSDIELVNSVVHDADVDRDAYRSIVIDFTLCKLAFSAFVAARGLDLTASQVGCTLD